MSEFTNTALKINVKNQCKTCTRQLVKLAYQRSFWFRFFREPLKFIMRMWVKMKGIDLSEYKISNKNCINCNRFYKNALKDKSKLFVILNNLVNPLFDRWLEEIISKIEIEKAKEYAKSATINDN